MLKAREEYDLCRGVLDLTKELDGKVLSETELLAIRGRANAAHATIVVLPDTAATQSGVNTFTTDSSQFGCLQRNLL